MADIQQQMNQVVSSFVAQISDLARKTAIETLQSAFGEKASAGPSARDRGARAATGRRAKRTQDDLNSLTERVIGFIKGSPGLRMEQINKELGTTTKELALPIRKLVADGYLVSKGVRRATTYHVGRKSWKAS